jgi:hypothetical protein
MRAEIGTAVEESSWGRVKAGYQTRGSAALRY